MLTQCNGVVGYDGDQFIQLPLALNKVIITSAVWNLCLIWCVIVCSSEIGTRNDHWQFSTIVLQLPIEVSNSWQHCGVLSTALRRMSGGRQLMAAYQ